MLFAPIERLPSELLQYCVDLSLNQCSTKDQLKRYLLYQSISRFFYASLLVPTLYIEDSTDLETVPWNRFQSIHALVYRRPLAPSASFPISNLSLSKIQQLTIRCGPFSFDDIFKPFQPCPLRKLLFSSPSVSPAYNMETCRDVAKWFPRLEELSLEAYLHPEGFEEYLDRVNQSHSQDSYLRNLRVLTLPDANAIVFSKFICPDSLIHSIALPLSTFKSEQVVKDLFGRMPLLSTLKITNMTADADLVWSWASSIKKCRANLLNFLSLHSLNQIDISACEPDLIYSQLLSSALSVVLEIRQLELFEPLCTAMIRENKRIHTKEVCIVKRREQDLTRSIAYFQLLEEKIRLLGFSVKRL